ncbi:XTP/dITP diphosphatase [Dehalobacter restrictus]|uniref:dITP/XTP pyrophosphatase n=1 Tax=Dehalobacter restrictus TaxID=55583 RepID=A0A857DLA5_9FIRM|nr:XTP/dITP diphosphatase [Dehalobacter restrictus]QHA01511.1 XTP/dITP diphosphatase [Dehalobacter restrictus]
MQVLLATMNKGKVMELEGLLNDEKIEILSLSDLPDYQEVEESGSTFAENAFIKARAACAAGKIITLADDSGLEVDALTGAPGVFSARYAGEPKNDERNIEKLLTDLEGVSEEKRTARFRCALAIVCPDGREYLTEGSVEGRILTERIGTGGFGYDPVFYLPDLQKTMAELSLDEKNCLSHRARAFAKAVPLLTAFMKSF